MTKIYEKYRDSLVKIEDIPFKKIKFHKIISYPPAGNDVFECIGTYLGNNISFILKSERGTFSNFRNEVKILDVIKDKFLVPNVIESGEINGHFYIVLSKMRGEKLSDIFLENASIDKESYLYLYGQELAKIHKLTIPWEKAKMRVINDIPNLETYQKFDIWESEIIQYLEQNKPKKISYNTFIHGDFHYGNILWDKDKVTAILDWEYAGCGFKEQDIAWALILRPGQEFMNNQKDWKAFLNGYKSIGFYDSKNLAWCFVNGMLHFYLMNKSTNREYSQKLKKHIQLLIKTNYSIGE